MSYLEQLETERTQRLLDVAVRTYGVERQAMHLMEEAAELVVALSHVMRGRQLPTTELPGEVADVLIMVGQFVKRYGLEAEVKHALETKLGRLHARIQSKWCWEIDLNEEDPLAEVPGFKEHSE